jgi:hypothetical protein
MPTLNVSVTRVAYPPSTSEPDAWYILITSHGTAKGKMPWRPKEKEDLILDGNWTVYKGEREFKFASARLNLPVSARDQLHYVVARTSGLGANTEEMIWALAGEKWQEIPEGAVPRLSGNVYQKWRLQIEALHSQATDAIAVAALMGKGCTQNMAMAAVAKWGKDTLGIVNSDPYRLAELKHYSYSDVDAKIRQAYGIGDGDERRIRSAVVYALRRLTDRGDTLIPWAELFQKTTGLLGGFADDISDMTCKLFEDGTLKAFPESEGVSLAADWKAEMDIWDFINKQEVVRSE